VSTIERRPDHPLRDDAFEALLTATHALCNIEPIERALGEVAGSIGRATSARAVVIALLDEGGQHLRIAGAWTEDGQLAPGPGERAPSAWLGIDQAPLDRGYPVLLNGAAAQALLAACGARLDAEPASVVAFPIARRAHVSGVLLVMAQHGTMSVGSADTRLCQSIAEQIAAALEVAATRAKQEQQLAQMSAQANLVRMVLEDRGLDALIAALADLLENPVMVSDSLFHLLAASPNQEMTDRMRRDSLTQGGIPRHALDDPGMRLQFQRIAQLRTAVTLANFPEFGWVQRRIQAPVAVGDDILGWLSVAEAQRPFRPSDYTILREASVAVGLELRKRQAALEAEHRLRADFLRDLLSAQAADRQSITARASFLGIDLLRPWELLLVAADDDHPVPLGVEQAEPAVAMRRVLQVVSHAARQRSPQSVVVMHEEHILVLLPSPAAGALGARAVADAIRQEVTRVSLKGTVSVGIGVRCARIEDFARSYAQARRALEVVRSLGHSNTVATLDDLGIYGMLFRSEDPDELVRFARRLLDPLREHDARHGDALLETLSVFLDENGNHRQAAARLFIHVNTLSGRLQRIASVGNLDLRDSATRFNLQLALRILRLVGPGRIDRPAAPDGDGHR